MAVVENHALTFFPALNVFPNPDSRTPHRAGDNQSQVIAKNTLPQSAVFGDVLLRCENGKHGRGHSRNLLQNAYRLRTSRTIFLGLLAVGIEPEGLPLVAFGQILF